MKLALGTVQFGIPYGVSNTSGQVSADEVSRILSCAASEGIDTLDTASLYGNAESVLGDLNALEKFQIVTKTPQVDGEAIASEDIERFDAAFHESLSRLSVDSVKGLLVHRGSDILKEGGDDLYQWLKDLKAAGKIKHIGVSERYPEIMIQIIDHYDIDMVQIPTNLMDQRYLQSGVIQKMKSKNIEIHARSLYLQGLLLMESAKIDPFFASARHVFDAIEQICQKYNLTRLQLCLAYGLTIGADKMVVGTTSQSEITEIIEAYKSVQEGLKLDFDSFKVDDIQFLLPDFWEIKK